MALLLTTTQKVFDTAAIPSALPPAQRARHFTTLLRAKRPVLVGIAYEGCSEENHTSS